MNIVCLFLLSMIIVVCVAIGYPGYFPGSGRGVNGNNNNIPSHDYLPNANVGHGINQNFGMPMYGTGIHGPGFNLPKPPPPPPPPPPVVIAGPVGGYGYGVGYGYGLPAEDGGIFGTLVTVIACVFLLFVVIMTFGYLARGRHSKNYNGYAYGKYASRSQLGVLPNQQPIIVLTGTRTVADTTVVNTNTATAGDNNESENEDESDTE